MRKLPWSQKCPISGKEAAYFDGPEELKEKVDYYLGHDEERQRIAKAGYERCIKSNYRYEDMAREVLRAYENEL